MKELSFSTARTKPVKLGSLMKVVSVMETLSLTSRTIMGRVAAAPSFLSMSYQILVKREWFSNWGFSSANCLKSGRNLAVVVWFGSGYTAVVDFGDDIVHCKVGESILMSWICLTHMVRCSGSFLELMERKMERMKIGVILGRKQWCIKQENGAVGQANSLWVMWEVVFKEVLWWL